MRSRLGLLAATTAAIALGAPAAASAATLAALPERACYRSGQSIGLVGSGFTPSSSISITADGTAVTGGTADGAGNLIAGLPLGLATGQVLSTFTAFDQTNTANYASVQLRVTALEARLRPRRVRPNRKMRIRARGFTSGRVLYAHVFRRGFRRNVKVGRLKGDCHDLSVRRRLVKRGMRRGAYKVQFDTRKRFSKKTAVQVRSTLKVRRPAKRKR